MSKTIPSPDAAPRSRRGIWACVLLVVVGSVGVLMAMITATWWALGLSAGVVLLAGWAAVPSGIMSDTSTSRHPVRTREY